MNPLEQIIIDKIKKEGPITFETFMDMALYYPELGYYSSGENAIGKEGDFFTSPHLHPIFGVMLAKQLMEMWTAMDQPSVFHAVEIGAGAGYLCRDILGYLHKKPAGETDFRKALRYVIVEPYPHFEKKQRETLGEFAKDVLWVKSLAGCHSRECGNQEQNWIPGQARNDVSKMLSEQITGCVLSNELLDAFPVHLVETGNVLKEVYVDFDGNNLVEIQDRVSAGELTNYLNEFAADLPPGYRTEINLGIKNWLEAINAVMSKGFILTIDYGYSSREYYSEERNKGTLLCYHKHQFNENPYLSIGEQDITAHVNFSSLKKWGENLGLKTIGYCPQGTYLISSGIDEMITELYSGKLDYTSEVAKIRGLIFPQGMGASHQVMVQYKGKGLPELRGFSMRNLKDNL